MKKIYRRLPIPKSDFNKVAKQLIEITLQHGCSPLNLLHILSSIFSEHLFMRTPLDGCFCCFHCWLWSIFCCLRCICWKFPQTSIYKQWLWMQVFTSLHYTRPSVVLMFFWFFSSSVTTKNWACVFNIIKLIC